MTPVDDQMIETLTEALWEWLEDTGYEFVVSSNLKRREIVVTVSGRH